MQLAAMRVAEGGMEHIRILETESTEIALEALRKAGYQIIHVSQPINRVLRWNNSNLQPKLH